MQLLLTLAFTAAIPLMSHAKSALLTWGANPETNIVGYLIYVGTNSGVYANYSSVTNVGNVTQAVIPGLLEGITYYFAITAKDSTGAESLPSDELILAVPLMTPLAINSGAVAVQTNGFVKFNLSGPSGRSCLFQSSTDLVHWVSMATNVFTNSALDLRLPDPPPRPKSRFYRFRLQ